MINVSTLPSSQINREVDELRHRRVPLTFRRFADPFKIPDNTALLQALLLAQTGNVSKVPDVLQTTTNSAFSQGINSLKPEPVELVGLNHSTANNPHFDEPVNTGAEQPTQAPTQAPTEAPTKAPTKAPTEASQGSTRRRWSRAQIESVAKMRAQLNRGHIRPSKINTGSGQQAIEVETQKNNAIRAKLSQTNKHIEAAQNLLNHSKIRPSEFTRRQGDINKLKNFGNVLQNAIDQSTKTINQHKSDLSGDTTSKLEKKKSQSLRFRRAGGR